MTLPPAPDLVVTTDRAVDVSVVIPSYNYGQFIDECLASVYAQRGSGATPVTHGAWGLVERDLLTQLLRLNIAPPHAFLIPRSAVEDIGGFDASYRGAEDYDFFLRVCGAGYLPSYCAEGLVYYRKHTSSLGATKARNRGYPFDVLVHRKKHQGAYGALLSAALDTAAGALALSDGVLVTASIIDPAVNATGRAEMVAIAKHRLQRFLVLAEQDGGPLNETARLCLARIASRAVALRQIADPELDDAVKTVLQIHHRWPRAAAGVLSRFPYLSYDDRALLAANLKRILPAVWW